MSFFHVCGPHLLQSPRSKTQVQSVISSVVSQGQTIRKPTMLFSVSGPYCRFADEVSPERIGTWSQLLACAEIVVLDDVALMQAQYQIRRLEIAMNWAPWGPSCPDTFYVFRDSSRGQEFL